MTLEILSIEKVKYFSNFQYLLDTFSCSKDISVEKFLKEKSISFQDRNRSRTWLVFEKDNYDCILGFVSTGLTVLELSEDISKNKIKNKDGFRKDADSIACHLVGQLAKNDSHKEKLGAILLSFAEKLIESSIDNVAGRNIVIDVRNSPQLIKFYEDNGYEKVNGSLDVASDILRVVKTK